MRAVDPSLKLIAVGEGIFPHSDEWNSAVLRIAGPEIQYLAVHDYTSVAQNAAAKDPRNAMMARPAEFEANYRHMADEIRQNAPGRDIHLIVHEWNLFYDAVTIQSMEGAVYAAHDERLRARRRHRRRQQHLRPAQRLGRRHPPGQP